MLRKLVIVGALAALTALPAAAATSVRGAASQTATPVTLMPGVTYERQVEFTPHGPVVLDVVTAPRPDGSLYTLAPVLSNGAVVGTDRLTQMEKDASTSATVVDKQRGSGRAIHRVDSENGNTTIPIIFETSDDSTPGLVASLDCGSGRVRSSAQTRSVCYACAAIGHAEHHPA